MAGEIIWKETDVLVAGGGVSGVIAAAAAARTGARTILIERNSFFGGTATASMVGQFFAFYHSEQQTVAGIPWELLDRLKAAGGGTGFARYLMAETTETPIPLMSFCFDPEILKIVLDEFLMEAGVDLLLCAKVADVVMNEDALESVIVEGVSEKKLVKPKCTVDATGDAMIAYKAGAQFLPGPSDTPGMRQPMSLIFRLTGVDVGRVRSLPRDEKMKLAKEGLESGELVWKSLGFSTTPSGTDAVMMASRVMGLDALSEEDMTLAHIIGRNQVKKVVQFLRRRVPGFEKASLVNIAPYIGVRETRQILGEYVLTDEDVLGATPFSDSVAIGSGPYDIHQAGTGITLKMPDLPFGIPFRTMIPKGVTGLIVTGRAISATKGAVATLRHMGTTMALGHAAGTAAALAVQSHAEPAALDIERLKTTLVEQGALISPERL